MSVSPPLALIAELTHRCPLHCVYCSNPHQLTARSNELPTEVWSHVFGEAAALGVMQLDLTGGEPLARPISQHTSNPRGPPASSVNLITSGLPLDEKRLDELVSAASTILTQLPGRLRRPANEICGSKAHAQKLRVLDWLKSRRVAVTSPSCRITRLDQLGEMLAIAENSPASRVEFAHVQYYGWAFANREQLLPTRDQLVHSLDFSRARKNACAANPHRIRRSGLRQIPKLHGRLGTQSHAHHSDGRALPATPRSDPGLQFENVRENPARNLGIERLVSKIAAKNGCRDLAKRAIAAPRTSGFRCQALLLAGDAAATDPVCSLALRSRVTRFAQVNSLSSSDSL
jgi:pyrroloquinoline quinone biosynthesis protein E